MVSISSPRLVQAETLRFQRMSSLWLEEIMQLGSKKTHIVDVEMVQQHTTAKMVCKPCCKAQTQLPLGMSEARRQ